MEVEIIIPDGSKIDVVEKEYQDIEQDDVYRYFVGRSSDEQDCCEWLDYNEAVALCGFVAGAIPDSETLIEGNGPWAQSMISRKDFSSMAASDSTKLAWKKTSNLFWKHFRRGRKAAGI